MRDPGLFLQHQLGVPGDASRGLGGEGDGLVEAVGMQALGSPEGCGQRLERGADDVVVRVLLGE